MNPAQLVVKVQQVTLRVVQNTHRFKVSQKLPHQALRPNLAMLSKLSHLVLVYKHHGG